MKRPRFVGLTKSQDAVFAQICVGNDTCHHPKTLKALEAKGMIVGVTEQLPGWPPVTVKRYSVPIAWHAAWCQWCSDNYAEDDS